MPKHHFLKPNTLTGNLPMCARNWALSHGTLTCLMTAPAYAKQWDQLLDTAGFKAPWGITTAERRHPHCSVPMAAATAASGMAPSGRLPPPKPLKGLANLLTNYKNKGSMTSTVFYDELRKYALSHIKRGLPYLGEYQDEKNRLLAKRR
jgi:hypothetical protein